MNIHTLLIIEHDPSLLRRLSFSLLTRVQRHQVILINRPPVVVPKHPQMFMKASCSLLLNSHKDLSRRVQRHFVLVAYDLLTHLVELVLVLLRIVTYIEGVLF